MKLALGRAFCDPDDPMGKMFFNILATFAGLEVDFIGMRTREGMAIARAKRKLRGKQPKLSDRQQRELCRMHATGEYSISDLTEPFPVSRQTVYRTLNRRHSTWRTILPPTGINLTRVDFGLGGQWELPDWAVAGSPQHCAEIIHHCKEDEGLDYIGPTSLNLPKEFPAKLEYLQRIFEELLPHLH